MVRSTSRPARTKNPPARPPIPPSPANAPSPPLTAESAPLRPTADALPLLELLERVDHGVAVVDPEGIVRWCNPVLAECYLPADSPTGWSGRTHARAPFQQLFRPLFPIDADWMRIDAALGRLRHTAKDRLEIQDLALSWGGRDAARQVLRRVNLVLYDLGRTADTPSAANPAATDTRVTDQGDASVDSPPIAPFHGWVAWYFYDVTEQRRTEENLQTLLKHSSDGIFMIDANCRLRLFNEACERITGFRADEVLHTDFTFSNIFQCAGAECLRVQRHIPELCSGQFCFRRGATHHTQEMRIKTRTGGEAWVEISYAPVCDDAGRVTYVLGILRDLTPRRQLEEQLRLTRKLATLGELTSAMAHEIKNPLGIILSAAEIIMNPQRPEEQKRQAAEFIRDETKRLDERMKVFLKFSRPKPPQFTPQNINRVLTQSIIAYRTLARPGLVFQTRFAPKLPRVSVDADQMLQVFLNLLVNADQAMPAGGTILISTRRVDNDYVCIEIADEGIGLPEGEMSRLFEPFFSTKPKGSGLGLSIVMQIIVAHRGKIETQNRPEGGAMFSVTLPIAPPEGQGLSDNII